jgi:hypothetical protein
MPLFSRLVRPFVLAVRLLVVSLAMLGARPALAQAASATPYDQALNAYEQHDYPAAAQAFTGIDRRALSPKQRYDGACIYALNHEPAKAFALLHFLVNKQFYANYDHLATDADLTSLHPDPQWPPLLVQVAKNRQTQPQRQRATIYAALTKARTRLRRDNGRLWGYPLWNDSLLVLDTNNTVYSLRAFPGSTTADGRLFQAQVPANTLVFVNTVQTYKGHQYAVVLASYLTDHSVTLIHELFHLLHLKHATLHGEAIKYLDEYEARLYLRFEYQALRSTLQVARRHGPKAEVTSYLEDALVFRQKRQTQYQAFLASELELETLEGLATYTGFALASLPDTYEAALAEIAQRERAPTYTRPFPYATGVAYGLLFDYLGIHWRDGLQKVYDFRRIYETHHALPATEGAFAAAKQRTNVAAIEQEENERRHRQEKLLAYYRTLLTGQPTLQVTLADAQHYGRTFNMNGTLELPGLGTVYSGVAGRDKAGHNFGDFHTLEAVSALGQAGVLLLNDGKTFVFPTPFRLEGRKLIGETYEIDLHEGWQVEPVASTGNYVLRQTSSPNP